MRSETDGLAEVRVTTPLYSPATRNVVPESEMFRVAFAPVASVMLA